MGIKMYSHTYSFEAPYSIVNILQWSSELGIHNQTERKVTWNIKQAKIWMVARAH
jgi:hypothetical protein